eukprot:m.64240 g.64240  ORF g.64240 m.64240 type:complete len:518 (+) comp8211_c0_seq2:674-2227(+)
MRHVMMFMWSHSSQHLEFLHTFEVNPRLVDVLNEPMLVKKPQWVLEALLHPLHLKRVVPIVSFKVVAFVRRYIVQWMIVAVLGVGIVKAVLGCRWLGKLGRVWAGQVRWAAHFVRAMMRQRDAVNIKLLLTIMMRGQRIRMVTCVVRGVGWIWVNIVRVVREVVRRDVALVKVLGRVMVVHGVRVLVMRWSVMHAVRVAAIADAIAGGSVCVHRRHLDRQKHGCGEERCHNKAAGAAVSNGHCHGRCVRAGPAGCWRLDARSVSCSLGGCVCVVDVSCVRVLRNMPVVGAAMLQLPQLHYCVLPLLSLLWAQFLRIAKIRKRQDGCCCIAILIVANEMYVINVGDSRAVLGAADRSATALSEDHKPERTDEKQRIEKAGGQVIKYGPVYRVTTAAALAWEQAKIKRGPRPIQPAIARTFGDASLKLPKPILIATPEIRHVTIKSDDALVLLGCDGIWDVLSNQQAVDVAFKSMDAGEDPKAIAGSVVKLAYARGSTDNISVVAILFRQDATADTKSS